MKKLMWYAGLGILVSSCSLFKRSDKKELASQQGYRVQQVAETKEEQGVSSSASLLSETDKETYQLGAHEVLADEILIDPQGHIRATGKVTYKGVVQTTGKDHAVRIAVKKIDSVSIKQDTNATIEQARSTQREVTKTTRPSLRSITFLVLIIVVVLTGLFWYIKKK